MSFAHIIDGAGLRVGGLHSSVPQLVWLIARAGFFLTDVSHYNRSGKGGREILVIQ